MLEVKHNVPAVQRWVAKVRRQIPWATAQAINQTAKDGQRFQRAYQLRAFDVTRPQWVSRAVKIKPFANKRRGGRVAAPVGPTRLIRRTRRFPNIRARYGPFKPAGRDRYEGKKRTFLLDAGPKAGVYQMVGRGKNARARLLWTFKQSVPIDRRLKFRHNIRRVVHRFWDKNFHKAWVKALRTAR
jgi:hypothetical protein